MPFETVKDVLDHARAFHQELEIYYDRMSQIAEKERVQILLEYLSRHERHLDECLAAYENDAVHAVLDTWYKYTPDKATVHDIESLQLKPSMTLADVIAAALKMDQCLVELYQEMLDRSVSEDIKELFKQLLTLEKTEEVQLVRDAVEMEDT